MSAEGQRGTNILKNKYCWLNPYAEVEFVQSTHDVSSIIVDLQTPRKAGRE
jgi:hypothetical protein